MKPKRVKTGTGHSKIQNTADDQMKLGQLRQGALEQASDKEFLAWAATQRKLYKKGELPDAFIKALEAVPGWTWEQKKIRGARNRGSRRAARTAGGWVDPGSFGRWRKRRARPGAAP